MFWCSIRLFPIFSYLFKWVLIPIASVWRKLGPLMDLLPGTTRSGAATGFCCNNDDKFTSLSCLAALAYIKKLLCNINKWREQSVLCTAQTLPQSIYRGLCGVRRARASSGPGSNALRGLKVNIVMKHIWWSPGPRLQSSKIVIIQWFWSAFDDLLTNDAIIHSWDFLSSLCYGNC